MKNLDLTIDQESLQTLFLHARNAYKGYSFEHFCHEIESNYVRFASKQENPKSYSQWVNGQIIALT